MKKRILVADNSLSIQKLVLLALTERDFEILTASDGADALIKAKTKKPSFILADSRLDGLDSLELISQIRKEPGLSQSKIILLRSSDDGIDGSRTKAAKIDAVLIKPFDAKALLRSIDDLDSEESKVELAAEDTTTIVLSEPTSVKAPALTPNVSEEWVRSEIRQWLDKNMQALCEQMIKDEISRRVS